MDLFGGRTPQQLAEAAYMKAPGMNPNAILEALAQAPDPALPAMQGIGLQLSGNPSTGLKVPQGPSLGAQVPPAVGGPVNMEPTMGTGLPKGGVNPMSGYAAMLPYMMQAAQGNQYQYQKGKGPGPMLGAAPKGQVALQARPAKPDISSIGSLMGGPNVRR